MPALSKGSRAAPRSAVSRGVDFSYHGYPLSKGAVRNAMSCARQPAAVFSRGSGAHDEGTGADFEGGSGGKLKSWEADAIMCVTDRTMLRWRERLKSTATAVMGLPEANADEESGASDAVTR